MPVKTKKLAYPEVALIAVLFTAIIVSHIWAPTSAAAVLSMASTLVGFWFSKRGLARKPTANAAPVLSLVKNEKGEDK